MALNREARLRNAERLLKQGRVEAALAEFRSLVEDQPHDLFILNRAGDILAKLGRNQDAIGYYEKIAAQFARRGFAPKAVAIYKKILKLDPERTEAMVRLGELYLTQQLGGEARVHLLRAADRFLQAKDYASAREAYEKLVEAEPDDARHRVRLAETRAAEGETELAGAELLELGDSLLVSGEFEDAARAFGRAAELLPSRSEPAMGAAFSTAAQGNHAEAAAALEGSGTDGGPTATIGAAILHGLAGNGGRAEQLLGGIEAGSVDGGGLERVVRYCLAMKEADRAWAHLDRLIERWGPSADLANLLSRLVGLEEEGHLPALERLHRMYREDGNKAEAARVMERLVQGYRARGMEGEATRVIEELRQIVPASSVVSGKKGEKGKKEKKRKKEPKRDSKAKRAKPKQPASDERGTRAVESSPSTVEEAEAPAVPLSHEDREFVSGHMTEAEVLQKYGLLDEAVQRLQAVATRFPGLVDAQEKLAGMARAQGDRDGQREALVRLALARRAAGETDRARQAAREAEGLGGLDENSREVLERLSLIETAGRTASETTAAPAGPEASKGVAVPQAPPETASQTAVDPRVAGAEVEIVFDEEEAEEAAPAEDEGGRVAPQDVIEEIRFYQEQGMIEEAQQRLGALRTLGYGGPELDALASALEGAADAAAEAEATIEEVEEIAARESEVRLGDDELGEIAAALEAGLPDGLEAEAEPSADMPTGEENLEEVFAVFKQHVENEVDSEDHRTHYDLGIAYKEMGLLQDALAEFESASRSTEMFREACSMLALCHRDLGNMQEAADWYRKAIEAPGGNDDELQGLRYDLADVLLEQGNTEAALDLFRHVLETDPGYRDVQNRVTELQDRLGT